jgi:alanine racemase
MPAVDFDTSRLTKVFIHLDRLSHNMHLLQQQVGQRPLWPCIKANAYGHGAQIIGKHLLQLGYNTFGVADVGEATALIDAGINATFVIFSATLPAHSEALVAYDCEPAVCTFEMVEALARDARKCNKRVSIHIKVDTGMGRIGIYPEQVQAFIEKCRDYPAIHIRGIMSHFPRADEADKSFCYQQIETFKRVAAIARPYGIGLHHMANSAAILDLPDAYFDAARPGIAIYGLRPSWTIQNPQVESLRPVLEWKSRITFLKEVPAGTGLSYGHVYTTRRPSLIATVPVGYGDGLSRNLSGKVDFLIGDQRCPQIGRITMDMCLVDVTALRGRVNLGDEVVIIGVQQPTEITADELAENQGTINYEIATAISHRVPRIVVHAQDNDRDGPV